jgi:hypothetical protein
MGERLHQVNGAIAGTMTTLRRPGEGTFSEN